MERRYRETESSSVREELSKYVPLCGSCQGTRLCADARGVVVDGRTLPSITELPVGDAFNYFEQLEMEGRQGEIADKILKEFALAIASWSTLASTTSRLIAVQKPCRVVKRNVFDSPLRLAQACWRDVHPR